MKQILVSIFYLFLIKKTELEDIEKFLLECGYSPELQGKEEITETKIGVLEVLKKVKILDAITIAAHVDSNKGIYNDLKGHFRSRVFKSEFLDGISVNNVIQIEKIKSLLKNSDYKRDEPLAIIQSSDHHKKDDCGRLLTYFDIDTITFDNLQECFKNPNEKISSTELPEIKSIINKIANDENTICIPSIDMEYILKTVTAILNNNYGSILLGVTNDQYKNIKGIKFESDTVSNIKESITQSIKPSRIFYSLSFSKIPFGENTIIHIRINNISNKIFFYNNDIFLLNKDNQDIMIGNHESIIELVNEKNIDNIQIFQNNIDDKIHSLCTELEILQNSYVQFNIVRRLLNDSIRLNKIVNLNIIKPRNDIQIESKYIHGEPEGKCYYAVSAPPRFDDTYLRCSCPVIDKTFKHEDIEIYDDDSIIIAPGGCSHIILDNDYQIVNFKLDYPLLKLSIKKEFIDLVNIKTLLLWLKSSLFIWLSQSSFGDVDIFSPSIYNQISIPVKIFESKTIQYLEDKVTNIFSQEKKFLEKQVLLINSSNESEELQDLINAEATEHNNCIHLIANEIDNYFYDLFKISKEEVNVINQLLSLKEILFFNEEEEEEEEDNNN